MHKHVVVIGGGISGLTCAYRLKQQGLDVLLVERDTTVGGVMKSEKHDGFLTELGPNSFQNAPEIMQLISEVGLDDELVTAPGSAPRFIYYKGVLQAFPMSPLTLFSTSLLTFGGKVRIFLEPFAAKPVHPEESVAEFITRRFGRQVLEAFVDPFVSGVYAGDPSRLCMKSTFPMLTDLEQQYGGIFKGFIKSAKNSKKSSGPRSKRLLCSFKEGMHRLPQRLAERLDDAVITNAKVVNLTPSPSTALPRFSLTLDVSNRIQEVSADAVILSMPAFVTADMVNTFAKPLADVLTSIEYPTLASVCLGYDKAAIPRPVEGFGFLIPRNQGLQLLGCLWSSSLFPGRAPDGKVCLTNFIGGATNPSVRELSDDQLVQTVHRELQTTMGVQASPHVIALHRYPRAIPQYNLGHQSKLQQIEAYLKQVPGLFLATNYLHGVSVGDCVKEANRVAESVGQCFTQPSATFV